MGVNEKKFTGRISKNAAVADGEDDARYKERSLNFRIHVEFSRLVHQSPSHP